MRSVRWASEQCALIPDHQPVRRYWVGELQDISPASPLTLDGVEPGRSINGNSFELRLEIASAQVWAKGKNRPLIAPGWRGWPTCREPFLSRKTSFQVPSSKAGDDLTDGASLCSRHGPPNPDLAPGISISSLAQCAIKIWARKSIACKISPYSPDDDVCLRDTTPPTPSKTATRLMAHQQRSAGFLSAPQFAAPS